MYKVFIVDDEPSVLEGMRIMVPWDKYDFVLCGEASDAKEALKKIIQMRPHLVITDIRMPSQNGLEMISEIRKLDIDLEFVILSGYADFYYAKEAMRCQVDYYMLKPLDMDEVDYVLKMVKKKLDDNFLTRYGFTQDDIAAFRSAREKIVKSDASKYECDETRGVFSGRMIRDSFDEELTTAVKLMNYESAEKLINELFSFFAAEKTPLSDVHFIINSLIYDILHTAFERNIRLNTDLLYNDDRELSIAAQEERILKILSAVIRTMLDERRKNSRIHLYNVKEYIERNFDKELSVTYLAEREFLEPGYLGEAFSKQFGCSISEYQHRLRIKKAIELIRSSDMTLNDISACVGYNNYNNFFTHFERITKKKPAQYRERN